MRIKEYNIIFDGSMCELERLMRSAIINGWQPIGGISYDNEEGENGYLQAIVKYEEEKPASITKNLIDVKEFWLSTYSSMNDREIHYKNAGWETFKKESLHHEDGMSYHIIFVKWENK